MALHERFLMFDALYDLLKRKQFDEYYQRLNQAVELYDDSFVLEAPLLLFSQTADAVYIEAFIESQRRLGHEISPEILMFATNNSDEALFRHFMKVFRFPPSLCVTYMLTFPNVLLEYLDRGEFRLSSSDGKDVLLLFTPTPEYFRLLEYVKKHNGTKNHPLHNVQYFDILKQYFDFSDLDNLIGAFYTGDDETLTVLANEYDYTNETIQEVVNQVDDVMEQEAFLRAFVLNLIQLDDPIAEHVQTTVLNPLLEEMDVLIQKGMPDEMIVEIFQNLGFRRKDLIKILRNEY